MRAEGGRSMIWSSINHSSQTISRASVVSISGEDHGVKSVSKFSWVIQYFGISSFHYSSIFQCISVCLYLHIPVYISSFSVSQLQDNYAHFIGEQMDKSSQCCHWAGYKGGWRTTQKAWHVKLYFSQAFLTTISCDLHDQSRPILIRSLREKIHIRTGRSLSTTTAPRFQIISRRDILGPFQPCNYSVALILSQIWSWGSLLSTNYTWYSFLIAVTTCAYECWRTIWKSTACD